MHEPLTFYFVYGQFVCYHQFFIALMGWDLSCHLVQILVYERRLDESVLPLLVKLVWFLDAAFTFTMSPRLLLPWPVAMPMRPGYDMLACMFDGSVTAMTKSGIATMLLTHLTLQARHGLVTFQRGAGQRGIGMSVINASGGCNFDWMRRDSESLA